jgi:peptide/nickel transport system ATP-binding protein
MSEVVLEVEDLCVEFGSASGASRAVEGISFEVRRGETFALLGESGCGKSVTALSIMRLLPGAARIVGGSVRLGERDLFALPERAMRDVRGGSVSMIFQEPMTSLNPVMNVGEQIAEALRCHKGISGGRAHERVVELLDAVGIPEPQRRRTEYPHQLSGGMKQRVMIAMALAGEPRILIADEPTTALDVTIQAQVLELLGELQRDTGMAILFITHDLGVVSEIADRVAVMYDGRIVEQAERNAFFQGPSHAYSRRLFELLPGLEKRGKPLQSATVGVGTGAPTQTQDSAPTPDALLRVTDLKVHYPIHKGVFRRVVDHVRAVDGVSLEIPLGRTLALVGESGCGKTTLGKGILQLVRPTAGDVWFGGRELTRVRGRELRDCRAQLQVVFQDPYSSMNPRMLVRDIIEEGMRNQGLGGVATQRAARVEALLEQVGLPADSAERYPHEFSGGQRQRICIARALAVEPRLIVCDEPTSALDVSVQAQILDLLGRLQRELGLTFLFITHNLSVVAYFAHEVAVMYFGKIVERGAVEDVLTNPQHPYTRKLLAAVPSVDLQGA